MSEDPTFEREKWLSDLGFRQRELALKERDQENRNAEVALKVYEQRASAWRSPLIVAIFAAAVAAAGNAVVTVVNSWLQRELEDKKAESTRILEMIKTGDPERAALNLEFLLESGLISDPALSSNIKGYLNKRQPGDGPSLPAPSGRVEFEKSDLLTKSLEQRLQDTLKRYFDYLDRIGFPKPSDKVTVSIEAMDSPNAYYVDNRVVIDQRIAEDPTVALREYNHHILTTRENRVAQGAFGALESGLADYFACSFLNNPNVGEKLGGLFKLKTPFIRTLKNNRTYTDLPQGREWEIPILGGEVWGGLFWDIREQLGPSDADALAASTWLSFTVPGNEIHNHSAFVDALLKAAEAKGPNVVETVQAALSRRKLSL